MQNHTKSAVKEIIVRGAPKAKNKAQLDVDAGDIRNLREKITKTKVFLVGFCQKW